MKGNLLVFVCFLGGIACGATGLTPAWLHHPDLPVVLLSALILQVGIGLGADDSLRTMVRSLRPRMFLLPLFTIAGTLLFAAPLTLLPGGWTLPQCLALGSGFGYYSLSSVMIAHVGGRSLRRGAGGRTGHGGIVGQRRARNAVALLPAAFCAVVRECGADFGRGHQFDGCLPAGNCPLFVGQHPPGAVGHCPRTGVGGVRAAAHHPLLPSVTGNAERRCGILLS